MMAIAMIRRTVAAASGLATAGMVAGSAFAQDVLGELPVIGKPEPRGVNFQPAATELARDQQWLDHFVLIIITVFAWQLSFLLFDSHPQMCSLNPFASRFAKCVHSVHDMVLDDLFISIMFITCKHVPFFVAFQYL